ncbi:MAG: beta-N-acetylhexosaminidase [Acutalibacteraceae bacterium]|nr:beta-N-acetylhexosaminidase [Acutalibacteraceae bacterium]
MADIIPRPARAKQTDEKIWFSENTVFNGEFAEVAELFKNLIPKAQNASKNTLNFITDSDIAAEGYKILYSDGDINIFCGDKAGALYGFMTLIQLAGGKDCFNAVIIEDAPKYSWRGFMLDCSRHFWTVDKIKQILDYLAMIKMNVFHWHLCDDQGWRIEIKKYPLLTQKGAVRKGTQYSVNQLRDKDTTYVEGEYGKGLFYTQDDAREIVRYAAERNITVIPEIDVPGHSTAAIACYPEISCAGEAVEVEPHFGIFKNNLCVSKPEAYEFIKDVIDELCEIFPAPYFHIGGDEVLSDQWSNCPGCQALMKEKGLKNYTELQGYFNNILVAHLKAHGKQTIGWNEIISENLDSSAIPEVWTTDALQKSVEWAQKGGKTIQILYPYVYADQPYSIIPLSKTYNYNPVFEGFDDENILGFEMPQWVEYIPTEEKFDFQTFVRLLAMSEVAWTPVQNRNYENFEQRVENMRGYFKSIGITLAPKRIYCGNTFTGADNMPENKRVEAGRRIWRDNPDCEFNLLKY